MFLKLCVSQPTWWVMIWRQVGHRKLGAAIEEAFNHLIGHQLKRNYDMKTMIWNYEKKRNYDIYVMKLFGDKCIKHYLNLIIFLFQTLLLILRSHKKRGWLYISEQ